MNKIAVIYFPGTNCEEETKRSVESVGMKADIFRWNFNPKLLAKYDGYILPGGWSYEDRIRAGVISARDPIMEMIKEFAKSGKPVLGICNGAQILVETGLIPGLKDEIQMALAPNFVGFRDFWVNLKHVSKKKNAFNMFYAQDELIPMPIAHGEGRFTTKDKSLIKELIENNQIIFKYCDKDGEVIDKYPVNPNGAILNIAAITNKKGNVMAIMPHPERANWKKQLPDKNLSSYEDGESKTPARRIFESMKYFLENES